MTKIKDWVVKDDLDYEVQRRGGHYSRPMTKPSGLKEICGLEHIDRFRTKQYLKSVSAARKEQDRKIRALLEKLK